MDDDGTSMKNEEKTNRQFIMSDAISNEIEQQRYISVGSNISLEDAVALCANFIYYKEQICMDDS